MIGIFLFHVDEKERSHGLNLNLLITSIQSIISQILLLLWSNYRGLLEKVSSFAILMFSIFIQMHFINSSFTNIILRHNYVYIGINLILFTSIFSVLLMHIGKSFTYAEYTSTLQLLSYGFVSVLYATVRLDDINTYHFQFSFCSFLIIGSLMLFHFVANNSLISIKKPIYLILSFLISINMLIHFKHIIHSIIHIIVEILPWKLVIYWFISFLIFAFIWWKLIRYTDDLVIKRKSFHILSLVIFIPGTLYYPHFMGPAFGIALLLFIIVEYIRYQKILGIRFSNLLDQYLKFVTNKKDQSGPIIMSHFYLLLGCSIPFLFKPTSQSTLKLLSGTIILGIGDTFACIIGVNYGLHRIKQSGKSIEGTISGIMSSLLLFIVFVGFKESFQSALIPVVLSFILEAITEHIDNLFLPILMSALLNLFE